MMLDDGTVYRLGDDHYWVMTNNPGYEDWFAHVLSGLDVSVEDRTHQMPLMSVQGPRSRELLSKLTDADVEGLRYFHLFRRSRRSQASRRGCCGPDSPESSGTS
jgi:aminomethyltransferase